MSTGQNNKFKEQARRIRYSIINSITLFSTDGSVELIPIIDRLFLFFQDNVGIEIRETNTKRVVFSIGNSFPIKDKLTDDFLQSCVSGELVLSTQTDSKVYKLFLYNIDNVDSPILLVDDKKIEYEDRLNCLVDEINNDDSDKLKHFLHGDLIRAFENSNYKSLDYSDFKANEKKITQDDLNNPYSNKCKEAIRNILDDVFESFKGNPIIFSRDWNMIKFFAVIRYPSDLRSNELFTAQILLSSNQKKSFEANKSKLGDGFTADILEKPLYDKKTSLADICFKLDTVQFGLGYDPSIQRKEETELYKSLNNSDPQSVFYVPIHVNGCPWLALYRIIGREEEKVDNWSLNYEMYSQYTLLIAEKLRLKTKEVVFTLISSFLVESIQNNRAIDGSVNLSEFVATLNEMMYFMSCYFPFPAIILKMRSDEISTTTYLETFTENDYELSPNIIWQQKVKYTQEDIGEYKRKIQEIIKVNADFLKASNANRDLIAASYGLSHLYGNRLKLADKPRQEAMSLITKTFKLTDEMKAKSQSSYYEFRKLEELSGLFTIIAKQYTERVAGPFFEVCNDDAYLEKGELDLKKLIQLIFKDYIKSSEKKLNSPTGKLIIQPYIKEKRPYKILYENILLEVIRNFDKSGATELFIDADLTNNLIFFKNEMERKADINYSKEWQPINPKIFWGALYFLHLLLRETKTGEIFYAYSDHSDASKIFYKCGINFKGFSHE